MEIKNASLAEPRKAIIGPISCYIEGKELLGDDYMTFMGISLVGMIIGGVVPLILIGPMFCGMAICLLNRKSGNRIEFDQLFKGFDYFVQSLIAALLYMAIFLVCFAVFAIPFMIGVAMISSQQEALMVAGGCILAATYCAWILVAFVVPFIFFFACILIVDRQMEGMAAFQLASRGFFKNLGALMLTAIVGQLMMMIAFMLCIFPIFFALPIIVAGHFVAYCKIFGVSQVKPVQAEAIY